MVTASGFRMRASVTPIVSVPSPRTCCTALVTSSEVTVRRLPRSRPARGSRARPGRGSGCPYRFGDARQERMRSAGDRLLPLSWSWPMSFPCLRASSLHGQAHGRKAMKARWQAAGRLGKLAARNANGAPPSGGCPMIRRLAVPGYLTAETNARQALGGHAQHVAVLGPLCLVPARCRPWWRLLRTRRRWRLSSWTCASRLLSPLACHLFDQVEAFGASQRFGPERIEPGRQLPNGVSVFENLAGQRGFNIRRRDLEPLRRSRTPR